MLQRTHTHRSAAALMLGTIALAAFAPAAYAGHDHGDGHKWRRSHGDGDETPIVRYVGAPRVFVHEHSSCGGSTLAGFVGGLILGAAVSHAAPAPACAPPPRYYYYDPYCDIRYGSLDACGPHFRHCDHPRVVEVIEVRTGRCSDHFGYERGHWRDYGDDDDHAPVRYGDDEDE